MVFLITHVIRDISYFLVLFNFNICLLVLMTYVIGVNISEKDIKDDYESINKMVMFAIMIYRNTIGDIQTPNYDYWSDKERMAKNPFMCQWMIYIIWIVWALNIMFMLIVLLNFLIATISSAFENV